MSNELIVPSKENALEVYQKQNGLDPFLEQIKKEIDSFVPDVTTKKGRDAIASMAYKVAKSKTALDDVGKELVADLKELPKKIDAERKRVREILDAWRDQVRKPLTDWEQAEEDRIANHKTAIAFIFQSSVVEDVNSKTIKSKIADIESIAVGKHFEEFELEAMHAKEHSLEKLQKLLFQTEKHEEEQKELEKLRAEAAAREQKEREERMVKEAEERTKKEAEEKAKAEKEAAEKRELDLKMQAERRELELKLQAEKAEREKLEAIAKAEKDKQDAIEAEKQKQIAEAQKIEREKLEREKNLKHTKEINRQALKAFIDNGFSEDDAKKIITLIAKKLIPFITINY